MKKGNILAVLSWVVPVCCALLAIAVTYLQYARYKRSISDSEQADQKVKAVQDSITTSQGSKHILLPYLPATRQEETDFLMRVKSTAQNHQVKIQKWATVQVANTTPDSADAKGDKAKPTATPLRGQLEVSGKFENAFAFLNELLSGNRLLCIDAIKWTRSADLSETDLSCTITRFVVPSQGIVNISSSNQPGETK